MRSPYHPLTLFAYTGRIGRLQYFVGCLYLFACGLAGGIFLLLLGLDPENRDVSTVVDVVSVVPGVGMAVQRMRDFGLKWWWLPITYGSLLLSAVFWRVPYIGMIPTYVSLLCLFGLTTVMFFMPGKPQVVQPVEPFADNYSKSEWEAMKRYSSRK